MISELNLETDDGPEGREVYINFSIFFFEKETRTWRTGRCKLIRDETFDTITDWIQLEIERMSPIGLQLDSGEVQEMKEIFHQVFSRVSKEGMNGPVIDFEIPKETVEEVNSEFRVLLLTRLLEKVDFKRRVTQSEFQRVLNEWTVVGKVLDA